MWIISVPRVRKTNYSPYLRFSHSPNDNEDYTELTDIRNYEPWLGYPQNNINKASTNEHTGQFDYYYTYLERSELGSGHKVYLPSEPE